MCVALESWLAFHGLEGLDRSRRSIRGSLGFFLPLAFGLRFRGVTFVLRGHRGVYFGSPGDEAGVELEAGRNFLAKPFDAASLAVTVRRALDRPVD